MSKIDDKRGEYNIAGLAEVSGVSIRNIRAYRARDLLQAPERRGRQSIYTHAHVTRLRVISRLLDRGYTMANIHELLNAWNAGHGIASVLGLDRVGDPAPETPRTITVAELHTLFAGALTPAAIKRLVDNGYVQRRGTSIHMPRPGLLTAGAELARMGVPADALLDIGEVLSRQLDNLATILVDRMDAADTADVTRERGSNAEVAHVAEIAAKLRQLLDQAIASELADALQRALDARLGPPAHNTAGQQQASKRSDSA